MMRAKPPARGFVKNRRMRLSTKVTTRDARKEAAAPRDELEGALAVQMACTHTAALSVLARFSGGGGSERRVVALASAAARLMRAYSGQVETLRRLRHGGDQHVRVEHIHINEGAQAVIGSVRAPDRRHEATKEMPSQDQQIDSDR